MSPITESERALMGHISMWGSAGYPVSKLGRGWVWREAFGVSGSPKVYRTKREAVAAFEGWMELYRIRAGQEAYERAMAEQGARP